MTLRDAVNAANNTAGEDTITFAAELAGQSSALSHIWDSVWGASALAVASDLTIDGGSVGVTITRAPAAPGMRAFVVISTDFFTNTNLLNGTATDQRGVARPQAVLPDIGACELVPGFPSLVVTTLLDENDTTSDPAFGTGTSLREALHYAQSKPGADTITFAQGLSGTILMSNWWADGTTASLMEVLDHDVTIQGPGSGAGIAVEVSGGVPVRHFYVNAGGALTVENLTFRNGFVSNFGGSIWNFGTLAIRNCTFTANRATQDGGAINNSGNLTATNCHFRQNAANLVNGTGGAITHGGGTLDISNTVFHQNHVFLGGAINSSNGLTITDSTFSGNTVTFNGGALRLFGSTSITGSTFSGNEADNGGGGLISHGTTMLLNSTFAGNTALDGGAMQAWEGTLDARHLTITLNTATRSAGGMSVVAATTKLSNTLVAANAAVDHSPDISGTLQSASEHNLIGTGGSGGLIDGVNGNLVGIASANLGLGSLADNGGPTATIALLPGSPAINAGAVIPGLIIDQRGSALVVGPAPDIGAFESSSLGCLPDWRVLHGLAADGSQDLANPSGDGVANLLKYAFNMAPNAGDLARMNVSVLAPGGTSGLPRIFRDGSGRLVVEFVRRKAATDPGISYQVQTGEDLTNLQPLALTGAAITSIDAIWERVTITDPVVTDKRFGRVGVETGTP